MKTPARMVIEVIPEDITSAVRGDANGCAIYNAIVRLWPDLIRVRISEAQISFSNPTERQRFTWITPITVGQWIRDFDAGSDRPLTFTLMRSHAQARPMRVRTVGERQIQRQASKLRLQQLDAMTPAQRKARAKRNAKNEAEFRRGKKVA